jgi:hypothetical protein
MQQAEVTGYAACFNHHVQRFRVNIGPRTAAEDGTLGVLHPCAHILATVLPTSPQQIIHQLK